VPPVATATPPAPPCSAEVENWLTSRGVTFKPCRSIPLDKIKREESRRNQARAEALDPEVVDRYVVAVKAGEKFPPIVVYKSGSGFVIIDGNHRDEAHLRAKAEAITVYEVAEDTLPELIELLTVEANIKHGLPTSSAWRVKQALHLIATGQDPEVVYAATGTTATAVANARRIQKADERARRLGVYNWEVIPATSRTVLVGIQSDPVFAAAAEVVIDTAMTTDDLKPFAKAIRESTSEADALRIVGEVGDQRKDRKGRIKAGKRDRIANPRNQVLAALGSVLAVDPKTLPRLFISEKDRKEVAIRCADAALVLMEMEEVLHHALDS
jgi:hypothetical protein